MILAIFPDKSGPIKLRILKSSYIPVVLPSSPIKLEANQFLSYDRKYKQPNKRLLLYIYIYLDNEKGQGV